ncbi:hypothetical protein DL96DRAFT_686081 [Flagelloscypha sp. PMI_526]|nr:hypothetical protein DL96DRAFT_686081 [Flagelloscypha sp. PMI_526]
MHSFNLLLSMASTTAFSMPALYASPSIVQRCYASLFHSINDTFYPSKCSNNSRIDRRKTISIILTCRNIELCYVV